MSPDVTCTEILFKDNALEMSSISFSTRVVRTSSSIALQCTDQETHRIAHARIHNVDSTPKHMRTRAAHFIACYWTEQAYTEATLGRYLSTPVDLSGTTNAMSVAMTDSCSRATGCVSSKLPFLCCPETGLPVVSAEKYSVICTHVHSRNSWITDRMTLCLWKPKWHRSCSELTSLTKRLRKTSRSLEALTSKRQLNLLPFCGSLEAL